MRTGESGGANNDRAAKAGEAEGADERGVRAGIAIMRLQMVVGGVAGG